MILCPPLSTLRARVWQFGKGTGGSTSVEALIILPILLWAYMALFVYFDAFRTQNMNLKAAYTLADLISREDEVLSPSYINGLNLVYDYLTYNDQATWIRVSSVAWDATNNRYTVQWSYATKNMPIQDDGTINGYADKLPVIPVGDTMIVVETSLTYTPLFDVGVAEKTFSQFVPTRPRFHSKICYSTILPAPACLS